MRHLKSSVNIRDFKKDEKNMLCLIICEKTVPNRCCFGSKYPSSVVFISFYLQICFIFPIPLTNRNLGTGIWGGGYTNWDKLDIERVAETHISDYK